jgi:cytoskeleton protein RodZ
MDKGVGASLREARSRRKLSLAEVEAATKIRGRYLRALEAEDWDGLPGDTYARAFVRTYADYLGLDAGRLAEEVRRDRGTALPGEQLPPVDPRPRPLFRPRPRPQLSPRLLAALVSVALLVLLAVIGLSGGGTSGGGTSGGGPAIGNAEKVPGAGVASSIGSEPPGPGHALSLLARAEVWVCLLDSSGNALVDGQILAAGEREGPFRSGSFTVSLGNGEVNMTVDGRQASIAETANPVGFEIGSGGSLRQLSEGERPTCT